MKKSTKETDKQVLVHLLLYVHNAGKKKVDVTSYILVLDWEAKGHSSWMVPCRTQNNTVQVHVNL